MSTLNIANITDGTNSVETVYVARGSAKAWAQLTGTGTVSLNESFNVSSLTDAGTGVYNLALTNSFASSNYAGASSASNGTNTFEHHHYTKGNVSVFGLRSATAVGSFDDAGNVAGAVWGDLA